METPRICRGCFREWEGERCCPFCGWEPEKEYKAVFGWKTGDIFEKRYLLGMLYCRMKKAVIWRVYDNDLGVSCFVLRAVSGDAEDLRQMAVRVEKSGYLSGNPVKLLSIKSLGQKNVLLFSQEDFYGKPDAIQAVLRAKDRETPDTPDIPEETDEGPEIEQALPKGTVLDGRYQVLKCIGIGGFGIIYLCRDLPLCRLVAVKEYFPAEWAERDETYVDVRRSQMVDAYRFGLQSFRKEAKLSARFIHTPHTVTVYDILEVNDTAYLVMEYISGISIGREMRARDYRPFEPKEMAEILFPVMEALEGIHGEKIVHSDISPGNIMRSEEGEIFLIDLGAAKYALDSQPVLSAAFLKPDYAAPEQFRTAREGIPRDEGPWTDVYALGATMYYLLTGQKPPDIMQRLEGKNTKVALPGKCKLRRAKQWTKLLNRAMALEISERFSTAEELRKEVEKLLE